MSDSGTMPTRLMNPGFREDRHREVVKCLVARRKELGLSQKELADRLGTYKQLVSRVEQGERRLDVVELVDFATALELDPRLIVAAIPTIRN